MFGWDIVSRQLYFHIYYFFVGENITDLHTNKFFTIVMYEYEKCAIPYLNGALCGIKLMD
jgi:hypothetical protein